MSAGSGCEHDLLLFGSDAELVAAGWGFIADGINAGDLVIVHGGEHEVELLREAFDNDPRVTFAPGRERYQYMMGTIGQYQRLCERETAAGGGYAPSGRSRSPRTRRHGRSGCATKR
ncbi:MAG: hypothetical protein QOI16_1940 [Pseudonocardiales bacterium]|jgi:hypothetical protein|nr:hypothetical protein [Pseudonocardiales bacterium]